MREALFHLRVRHPAAASPHVHLVKPQPIIFISSFPAVAALSLSVIPLRKQNKIKPRVRCCAPEELPERGSCA